MIFSMQKLRRSLRRTREMSALMLLVMGLLLLFGLVMQYSAAGGDSRVFAIPQAIRAMLGLMVFFLLALMSYQRLFRLSYIAYGIGLMLLIVVELIGVIGMGAQRWVSLGLFNLQPSELMKIAMILAIARYFHNATLEGSRHLFLLVAPALLVAVPAVLILLQPNLGTATILLFIAFVMCFAAGIRWHYFAVVILAALAALPVGYSMLHDYQKRRVMTFLDPASDPLGAGYNIIQSQIAIGSGGFFGKGLLKGSQGQLDFLPEKQTDFIFTMLAEELGFIGSLSLLLLYAILLGFALLLMRNCRHAYGRLIAAGVTALLFAHIFINIAMVMGMIPVVGVPLPFLSYGGSFLMTTLAACGLLMHVYLNRDAKIPKNSGFEL
ncbi:MAG: rod shape-determining protein RodA [Alphaproteobacteria bacterium]|jgi:rod shape determining protein RodA